MEKLYNLVTGNLFLADINTKGTPTSIFVSSDSYAKFCIEFKDYFKYGCGSPRIKTTHVKSVTRDVLGNLFGIPVMKDESLSLNQIKVIW